MSSLKLRKKYYSKGETGNVFDHVTGLVVKILQDNPTDALSAFENLSFSLKKDYTAMGIDKSNESGSYSNDRAFVAQKTLEKLAQIAMLTVSKVFRICTLTRFCWTGQAYPSAKKKYSCYSKLCQVSF